MILLRGKISIETFDFVNFKGFRYFSLCWVEKLVENTFIGGLTFDFLGKSEFKMQASYWNGGEMRCGGFLRWWTEKPVALG